MYQAYTRLIKRVHLTYEISGNYFKLTFDSQLLTVRSSRQEVFCKKGVLTNFTKLTGKQLCQSLFFHEVEGLRSATLLKKRLWHSCFPVNFVKVLRTPFFIEHLSWLLLIVIKKYSVCRFKILLSVLSFGIISPWKTINVET